MRLGSELLSQHLRQALARPPARVPAAAHRAARARRFADGMRRPDADSARRSSRRAMWPVSVGGLRTNLRRAGMLKKRSRTSTVVPGGCAAGRTAVTRTAVDPDLRGPVRVCWMRDDAQPRHGADRGQRLAAKAEGGDGGEVIERGDLARGVPADRDRQLLGGDAAAVVAHAHEADAAALDVDFDAVCAGIEAVLDQLLDDRGGALDHFAGGDLIDELAGEDADGHGRQFIAPERAVKYSGQNAVDPSLEARGSPSWRSASARTFCVPLLLAFGAV